MKRSRLGQPEWASEEESRLAQEWVDSDSSLPIVDYVKMHASPALKAEYRRQAEQRKNMHFGKEVLPDGNVVIYN